jgi:hypothetical protein
LLAYAVDLTKESKCDVYKQALKPKILKIAVVRSDWKSTTTLKAKQALAVSAAKAQDKIASIDLGSLPSIHCRVLQHQPKPPPPPPPPTGVFDGVAPMDLDAISTNAVFTFPKF